MSNQKTQFYTKIMGDIQGPFTGSQIRKLAESGNLFSDSHVRKGVNGQWFTADTIKGLTFNTSKMRSPSKVSGSQAKSELPPKQAGSSLAIITGVAGLVIGVISTVAVMSFFSGSGKPHDAPLPTKHAMAASPVSNSPETEVATPSAKAATQIAAAPQEISKSPARVKFDEKLATFFDDALAAGKFLSSSPTIENTERKAAEVGDAHSRIPNLPSDLQNLKVGDVTLERAILQVLGSIRFAHELAKLRKEAERLGAFDLVRKNRVQSNESISGIPDQIKLIEAAISARDQSR